MYQFLTMTLIIIIVKVIVQNFHTNTSKSENGHLIIQYSKKFIWFWIVVTLIFISTLLALLITTKLNDFNTLGLFIVILLSCCVSIFFSIACSNWQIIFTNEKFTYNTFLGREYHFLFSDIRDYRQGTELIILRTNNKRLFLDPHLINADQFFNLIEKKGQIINKTKLSEIRLTKGNFLVGLSCLVFSVFMSFLFVIPNSSVEETVTSWWGYLIIIIINISIFIFTFGSLKWRIILNDDTFTYVTFLGKKYEFRYLDVNNLSFTSSFVIMKIQKKYFFIDGKAIGIEKFLRRVK